MPFHIFFIFTSVIFAAVSGFEVPLIFGEKISNNFITGRIVGGQEAKIINHPWQLSLHNEIFNGSIFFCGASIISPQWALTAAHCLQDRVISQMRVRAGSSYKNIQGRVYNVSQYFIHPEYEVASFADNDVGVFKIKGIFRYMATIRAIKMARIEPKQNDNVTVTGWGALAWQGAISNKLQVVTVPVVDRQSCNIKYKGYITENMICAGEEGRDACQGDSGGPLVDKNKNLVGIVSWGIQCAHVDYPGVYTNIMAQSVRKFIKEKTGI